MRKSQNVFPRLLILEVPSRGTAQPIIDKLLSEGVQSIYLNHYLFEKPNPKVIPYSIGEEESESIQINIQPDSDGIVRRIEFRNQLPITVNKIKTQHFYNINYRGPQQTFPFIQNYDLPSTDLQNKIVILKPKKAFENYTTPVGLISEAEVFANIIDNLLMQRFLPEKNFQAALIILTLLLIITIGLLIYLPSTLALFSCTVLTLTYSSLSLWVFDNFYFWTPILVPIIQMFLTYILISNYKNVLNEKTRWGLEKESLFFQEVEEMKTNFLSLFSHDLKTPLAKILGISDTLRSKITDPETLEEIEKIYSSSRDLEKYIQRILKMSQVQSKNVSLNKTPEDINSLIEKSIAQNQFSADEKRITIEKDLNPLFMIEMDGGLIQEVIINFIENAITYSPEGTVIRITSEEIKNYVKVSVKDQGQGVPKEAQESIWEKYYRFDGKNAGYGLGLFLSRYVINLHGGQVFLNSKKNQGSEFGFILPITEDES